MNEKIFRWSLITLLYLLPSPLPFPKATKYEVGMGQLLIANLRWGREISVKDCERVLKDSGLKPV